MTNDAADRKPPPPVLKGKPAVPPREPRGLWAVALAVLGFVGVVGGPVYAILFERNAGNGWGTLGLMGGLGLAVAAIWLGADVRQVPEGKIGLGCGVTVLLLWALLLFILGAPYLGH